MTKLVLKIKKKDQGFQVIFKKSQCYKMHQIWKQSSGFLRNKHTPKYKDHKHIIKVNSVQEACAKCFAVRKLKFEILQITWNKDPQNLSFPFFFNKYTGSSCLMRISLLRISLLRFFKTITKIWLMRFYGLFILLLRT